jgi:hypothetical protein
VSIRVPSLCSIESSHPFVPTCLLAERRAQRQSRMPPPMRRHRRSRRKASLTERARCYSCPGGPGPAPQDVTRGYRPALFSLDHWWEVRSLQRRVRCELAPASVSPFWLSAGRLRSNFVAGEPPENVHAWLAFVQVYCRCTYSVLSAPLLSYPKDARFSYLSWREQDSNPRSLSGRPLTERRANSMSRRRSAGTLASSRSPGRHMSRRRGHRSVRRRLDGSRGAQRPWPRLHRKDE